MDLITRRLFLVRHAQAINTQPDKTDKVRELKREGLDEAQMVGKYLKSLELNSLFIYSSPATRAITTAGILAGQIQFPAANICIEEEIYSGSAQDMFELIKQSEDEFQNLIFVGHLPTIAELHDYVSVHRKASFNTCEIVGIELKSNSWSNLQPGSGNTFLQYHPSNS